MMRKIALFPRCQMIQMDDGFPVKTSVFFVLHLVITCSFQLSHDIDDLIFCKAFYKCITDII